MVCLSKQSTTNQKIKLWWDALAAEYADRQVVTEQLKSENLFLWIQKMNNILVCVREAVENETIYS